MAFVSLHNNEAACALYRLQNSMRLTVKLFLGVMWPLGLLLMELWSCSFPLMLKVRGRRASPSGVGFHPAEAGGLLCRCGAKVASVCTCPQCIAASADQTEHHHLLCDGMHMPSLERLACKAGVAHPTPALGATDPMKI